MGAAEENGLTEILLQGSAFEIGEQHGKLLKNEIAAFLSDNLAQVNLLKYSPLHGDLSEFVAPYKEMINIHLPEIMQELEGLAKGAEISIDQAVLLQIRRELIGVGN